MTNNIRIYFNTDSELVAFTKRVCSMLKSDVAYLTEFGITEEKINELNNSASAFAEFPSDDYNIGSIMTQVSLKETNKSLLLIALREMEVRVIAKFGRRSTQHKNLNLTKINYATDDEIATRAKDTYSYLEKIQPELVEQGLTPEVLAALLVTIKAYEDAKIAASEVKKNRLINTRERIEMGNNLYNITRNYCNIAKRALMYNHPNLANHYVLPKRSPSRAKKPTNFIYDNSTKMFSWDAMENATSYQLQVVKNEEYVEIYAGEANHFAYELPQNQLKYFVRARNQKGFGSYSDELILPNLETA